jgi:hypothetical protein
MVSKIFSALSGRYIPEIIGKTNEISIVAYLGSFGLGTKLICFFGKLTVEIVNPYKRWRIQWVIFAIKCNL